VLSLFFLPSALACHSTRRGRRWRVCPMSFKLCIQFLVIASRAHNFTKLFHSVMLLLSYSCIYTKLFHSLILPFSYSCIYTKLFHSVILLLSYSCRQWHHQNVGCCSSACLIAVQSHRPPHLGHFRCVCRRHVQELPSFASR
jgi:hypothetical protein